MTDCVDETAAIIPETIDIDARLILSGFREVGASHILRSWSYESPKQNYFPLKLMISKWGKSSVGRTWRHAGVSGNVTVYGFISEVPRFHGEGARGEGRRHVYSYMSEEPDDFPSAWMTIVTASHYTLIGSSYGIPPIAFVVTTGSHCVKTIMMTGSQHRCCFNVDRVQGRVQRLTLGGGFQHGQAMPSWGGSGGMLPRGNFEYNIYWSIRNAF